MQSFSTHMQSRNVTGTRIKKIRQRVRAGKIQRNVKKSGVKGYVLRGGRLVRMSAAEKLHRRRGAQKARLKRRSKMARSLLKRKRSLRRRSSLGL